MTSTNTTTQQWKVNYQLRHGGRFDCDTHSEIVTAATDSDARREIYRRHPDAVITTYRAIEPEPAPVAAPPRPAAVTEIYDAAAARWPEGSTGHALRSDATVRAMADEFVRGAFGGGDFENVVYARYLQAGGRDADGVASVARAVRDLARRAAAACDTDPWDHARPGDTLDGFAHPTTPAQECGAERISADNATYHRCTRAEHPAAWTHLDVDANRYVRAAWRPGTPVFTAETPAAAQTGAGEDWTPGQVLQAGDSVHTVTAVLPCRECRQHFPADADGFINHEPAYQGFSCETFPATVVHTPPADNPVDHEPMWLADTAPESLRRRAAVLAWLANHQELPEPRIEEYKINAAFLRYAYPGPAVLAALYRALSVDEDAVSVDSEGGGFVRIEGWIGGWRALLLVDFDEHTDDFCSRLSASENPSRYLDIVAALPARKATKN